MKKIFFIVLIYLFGLNYLQAQDFDFYLIPKEKTVNTGSVVSLRVIYGTRTDTSGRIFDFALVKNWCVNGNPGDPNLIPGNQWATYNVPDQLPQQNPVAISCDIIYNDQTLGKTTLVSNIYIEDVQNQIVIDGAAYTISAGKDFSINDLHSSNVSGRVVGESVPNTVCNLAGNGVNIAITFPDNKPGEFNWNQETVVGGSINNQAYGSLDPYTKKSAPGETIVTEFGEVGKLIKGTFHGVLWTQVGPKVYSVNVSGKFSVVHSK